jgi:NhaP-type Na+/H+ or K+/H+ antiporter
MSSDDILTGIGLVVVLALGCELVAARTKLPAIVLLLPTGFVAGAFTDDVHPDQLFGATFQPLVSLGVGLILFEAGLRLRFDELGGRTRRVVLQLIPVGVVVTSAGIAVASELIFGIGWGPAVLLGAILVVSGPTVVLPLLEFVRPSPAVRSTLKWEGVLIDPIGALLGVIAFHAVKAGAAGGHTFHPGSLAASLAVGLAVGLAGALCLGLLLRGAQRRAPQGSVAAALLCVTAAVVVADLLREDSGFVAATVMGMALANRRELDVARVLEFQATVVRLLIGMLFVLISASVSPSSVRSVLGDSLILLAIMVLILRPLVVALGTWRTGVPRRERAFMAWLDPRGIVAASTASAFGPQLAGAGVAGADKILPITFVAIFGTVVIYGLTAVPVAHRLGVVGEGEGVVLIVGGHGWARALARALEEAGVRVRLWTGRSEEQAAALEAGLVAGNASLGVDLVTREAELEEVTDALLMTDSDDFNALAAFELRRELGHDHVFVLAPEDDLLDPVPEFVHGRELFGESLTFGALERRFARGAAVVGAAAGASPDGDGAHVPLFVVGANRSLRAVTATEPPVAGGGDTVIWLVD